MGSIGHMFFSKCPEKAYLAKTFRNYNAEDKFLILKNGGRLSFNQMGELFL